MTHPSTWIDRTLYPDEKAPEQLDSLSDKVDYLVRLCSAWDFGILPDPEVVAEIRKSAWREVVEECGLLTSPAYHLVRRWHGLSEQPFLGRRIAYIQDDPNLAFV